jgi:hypothetical protein
LGKTGYGGDVLSWWKVFMRLMRSKGIGLPSKIAKRENGIFQLHETKYYEKFKSARLYSL